MALFPRLRFRGFTDAWSKRKLGELARVFDGTHQTPLYRRDGVPFVSVENIATLETDKFISREAFRRDFKITPQTGDILMTRIGDVGATHVVPNDNDLAYYVSLALLKPRKDTDPRFLAQRIECPQGQRELWQRTLHVAFPKKINKNEIEEVPISSPGQLLEQTSIGEFFKTLDALIAANQRKCDLLQKLKRAYLQRMFPGPGEDVPRLRFHDFNDAWKQRKLGDVADIVGGGTPSTGVGRYWDGDIDWYAPAEIGEQIYVTGSQRRITELGLQESSAKILPVGAVLFTSRAGIGNTAILGKAGATNQGFQSIVPYPSDLDSYFIFSRTRELKRYGETMGAGSTFVEVSGKQMAQMPLLMPSVPEQQQIGQFFAFLDHLITLHQRECDQMKELKRAYLQKMFV